MFSATGDSRDSLWTLSLRDRKVESFGGTQSSESIDAVFSPDGRWVAFDSAEGRGRSKIDVEPFPRTGARFQVTNGANPFWSPDGRELFYGEPATGTFGVVTISAQPTFVFGNPAPVPRGPLGGLGARGSQRNYDLAPDGKQIFGTVDASTEAQSGSVAAPTIQVVLNWFEELKQRVPVN